MIIQDVVTFFLLVWIFAGVWMMSSGLTPLGSWFDWTVLLWWMILRKIRGLFKAKITEPITSERLRKAKEFRESDQEDK